MWITRRAAPLAALLCGIGRWGHAPGATLPRVEVSEAIRSAPPAPLVSATARAAADTTIMVDTTPPVLTVDLLERLKTFVERYRKEPTIVHDSGKVHRGRLHIQLPPEAAEAGMDIQSLGFPNNGTFPDIAFLAVRFPSVAADVQRAGLSARQIPLLAGAVWSAYLMDIGDVAVRAAGVSWSPDTTSVLMRNVAFLRQHKPNVDALGLFPLPVATAEDRAKQTSLDTGSAGTTPDDAMEP